MSFFRLKPFWVLSLVTVPLLATSLSLHSSAGNPDAPDSHFTPQMLLQFQEPTFNRHASGASSELPDYSFKIPPTIPAPKPKVDPNNPRSVLRPNHRLFSYIEEWKRLPVATREDNLVYHKLVADYLEKFGQSRINENDLKVDGSQPVCKDKVCAVNNATPLPPAPPVTPPPVTAPVSPPAPAPAPVVTTPVVVSSTTYQVCNNWLAGVVGFFCTEEERGIINTMSNGTTVRIPTSWTLRAMNGFGDLHLAQFDGAHCDSNDSTGWHDFFTKGSSAVGSEQLNVNLQPWEKNPSSTVSVGYALQTQFGNQTNQFLYERGKSPLLNNQAIQTSREFKSLGQGLFYRWSGTMLNVLTPNMEYAFIYVDDGYGNMMAAPQRAPHIGGFPHGMMGQSIRFDGKVIGDHPVLSTGSTCDNSTVEGKVESYKTSGPFATNDQWSRYGKNILGRARDNFYPFTGPQQTASGK